MLARRWDFWRWLLACLAFFRQRRRGREPLDSTSPTAYVSADKQEYGRVSGCQGKMCLRRKLETSPSLAPSCSARGDNQGPAVLVRAKTLSLQAHVSLYTSLLAMVSSVVWGRGRISLALLLSCFLLSVIVAYSLVSAAAFILICVLTTTGCGCCRTDIAGYGHLRTPSAFCGPQNS